ncbi:hypothetical protein RRG08_046976 [Elysia crispata]|uniref:Uncharacterized protein n=1 Tax=Elysia crispata TaxID=231223 RepID=A0AAE1DUG8_9GAST|nr:hypothetical protein RRG08_046976 [Elysia crispata]
MAETLQSRRVNNNIRESSSNPQCQTLKQISQVPEHRCVWTIPSSLRNHGDLTLNPNNIKLYCVTSEDELKDSLS